MASESKIGSYTGTGAALNIELGFVPDHVVIVNETDGDTRHEWFSGMTDGHALQSAASGANTKITSNGISALTGNASTREGFTAGTAVSEDTKTFRYVATRNGEY